MYFSERIFYWSIILALILTIVFFILLRWFAEPVIYAGSVFCGIVLLLCATGHYKIFMEVKEFLNMSSDDRSKLPNQHIRSISQESATSSLFLTFLFVVLFIVNLIFIICMFIHRKSINVACESVQEVIR